MKKLPLIKLTAHFSTPMRKDWLNIHCLNHWVMADLDHYTVSNDGMTGTIWLVDVDKNFIDTLTMMLDGYVERWTIEIERFKYSKKQCDKHDGKSTDLRNAD